MGRGLELFVEAVERRAGHLGGATLELVARSTLRAVGGHLGGVPPALHDAIPVELRPELAAATEHDERTPEEVYKDVAARTELRIGLAAEVVQSVVAELSGALAEPARVLLRASLPAAWAALVIDPSPAARARATRPSSSDSGTGHTLATGRPGGTRPIAEAVPSQGQTESIATSDDPHGDHTLAAASSVGPQREDGTLARGRPGSKHAVADSD